MGEKTVQVAVRIPESWIARADQLTGRLTMTPEIQVNRTDVLRAAIGRGLDALESQYGSAPTEPTGNAQKGGERRARKPAKRSK